jgi:hypothetical protein
MKYKQDLPPEGGYRDFNVERTFPKRLFRRKFWERDLTLIFSAHIVIPSIIVFSVYGFYQMWYMKRALM